MNSSKKEPTAAHLAFRNDALEVLRKHGALLPAPDMLAMASHMVGQIIAMQDQRKMTREMALKILMQNIEQGNSEVINSLKTDSAGNA